MCLARGQGVGLGLRPVLLLVLDPVGVLVLWLHLLVRLGRRPLPCGPKCVGVVLLRVVLWAGWRLGGELLLLHDQVNLLQVLLLLLEVVLVGCL